MNNILIRSMSVDGVEVTLCNGSMYVCIDGKIEIEAKILKDKTWVLYDNGKRITLSDLSEVWKHIVSLIDQHDLFSSEWKSKHYDTLIDFFKLLDEGKNE